MLGLDLIDQLGDALGRGLVLGRYTQGRDEFDAVGGAEIAEGNMAGDDFAPVGRDGCDGFAHLSVGNDEIGYVGPGVVAVVLGVCLVGFGEAFGDVVRIDLAVA